MNGGKDRKKRWKKQMGVDKGKIRYKPDELVKKNKTAIGVILVIIFTPFLIGLIVAFQESDRWMSMVCRWT